MNSLLARAKSLTFRARLGILVAAAVGLTVMLAALASYLTVRHELLSQADDSLRRELNSAQLQEGFAIDTAQMRALLAANNSLIQVIAADGTVIASSSSTVQLPVHPDQSALVGKGNGSDIRTVYYEGVPYRVVTEGGYLNQFGVPVALQVAKPLTDIMHTLAYLRLILVLVSLAGIGVAVFLGYLIGKAMLRPIERLTDAAEHVASTQDLDSKIEVEGHDELASLAHSFNAMLGALASSRQQQAQLISDAGHELRTPITSLRTNIEVLMKVPDLPDKDRDELVADIQGQLGELTTLIGDVVDLARDEETHAEPIEVRFDDVVARAVERGRRRAPSVTFDAALTPGSIRAQPAMLERAVLNVLDNAAKWSPQGGLVTVTLQRGASWSLDIRDHGPGISPEDLPHVFDRFYRAASARSMPGSGLGLAIVRQVVVHHGGTVSVSCPDSGGTLVHIDLPTVVEAEPDLSLIYGPTGSQPGTTPAIHDLGSDPTTKAPSPLHSLPPASQPPASQGGAQPAGIAPRGEHS